MVQGDLDTVMAGLACGEPCAIAPVAVRCGAVPVEPIAGSSGDVVRRPGWV